MKGFCGYLLTIFLGVGLVSVLSSAQSVNVATWHNDNGRTGQNTNEVSLTTSNVKNTSTFAITSGTRTTPQFEEVSLNCEINSKAKAEL